MLDYQKKKLDPKLGQEEEKRSKTRLRPARREFEGIARIKGI